MEENPHKISSLPTYKGSEEMGDTFNKNVEIYVVAAAVTHNGLIFSAPRPARHHHILAALFFDFGSSTKEARLRSKQGFILSDGTFATREEAAKIAIDQGQIKECKFMAGFLFSEDLW